MKKDEHVSKPVSGEEGVLLSQLADGDREAFRRLYLDYHGGLYNYILKFTKNEAAAEDLLQDIFLKIWNNRAQIDIQISFASYLYRCGRNAALNYLQRIANFENIREETLHRMSTTLPVPKLQNELEWDQYRELLNRAIEALPPKRRQAFILCREKGKSYEEACKIAGISRNTLKDHLKLAVRSIKQYLAEHGDIILFGLLCVYFGNLFTHFSCSTVFPI